MAIIKFKDVWEMYRIKFIIDGRVSWENYWALKGINLEVEKGESLGIIGENGAGKSTILKLMAGIVAPDRGEINVSGKASGLLELGAGFQPELTGKENVYFNANLFGLTISQIEEKYEEIVNFANIGKFIHAPIKCYSQGMFVRLAFAIAVNMDPDVLLIDDTLSVGDQHFQRKCIKKIFEIKEQGKIIVFVTHDMHMLNRLCDRAIFLKEGKIVKEGLTDKVVPLYVQTVGSRAGVDILEKKPLSLVFNNGRLFINWADRLLTPNSGAYTFFSVANRRYNSYQADWEVNRESENKIIARGKLYQLSLIQVWILEIANDYEIKWDIYIESEESLEIQEACINIMLSNKYSRWFTNLKRGVFPLINDNTKNWQPLLDSNLAIKCIGVETDKTGDSEIPPLSFEQLDAIYQAQVLNTDYLNNCRILQYKTLGLQNYSEIQSNRLIYFSGKIIVNILDTDNYLQNIKDELILSNEQIQLILHNGHGILSYNDIGLTKVNHMSTSIYIDGKWYSSALANWKIKQGQCNNMTATGKWIGLPIAQIWKLQIRDKNSIIWEIALDIEKEINIEQQTVSLMFSEAYKYWLTTYYGCGEFPDNFLMGEMVMLQRCIPNGSIGLKSENMEHPSIFLKFSQELSNYGLIYNSNIYDKARVVRVHRAEIGRNTILTPGEYSCFFIEINMDNDKKNRMINDSLNMLERDRLKFIFENGCGRIFWKNVELTKDLCLYTSVRMQGRWHDSAWCAVWELEEKDEANIKVSGRWLYLPMFQTWEIKLLDEKTIEFNVKMKITKEIEIERMQTNIMFVESYTQWLTNNKKKDFPPFKNDIDDNWDWVWSGECNSGYIGVSSNAGEEDECLPSVLLSSHPVNSHHLLNVINSDIYHRGRVLQFLDSKKNNFMPGEYLYYEGTIKIDKH